MNRTILLIGSMVCLSASLAFAQDNSTNTIAAPTVTTPSKAKQLGSDLLAFFTDAQPYFSNKTAVVTSGALENKNKYGAFLEVQFPIAQQASIGFAGAWLDGNFYDASVSTQLGTTWTVPLIGPVYTFIESGPGWNFQKNEVIEQSFAGALKTWDLGKGWAITANAAAGNISDRSGAVLELGLGVGFKW